MISGSIDEHSSLEKRLYTEVHPVNNISYEDFFTQFETPQFFWCDRKTITQACFGEADGFAASGSDRLKTIRKRARVLYENHSMSTEAPLQTESVLPRLYGGCSFFESIDSAGTWHNFAPAYFFLPKIQITETENNAWVTLNTVESTPPAGRSVLKDLRNRVQSAIKSTGTRSSNKIVSSQNTPSRNEWVKFASQCLEKITNGPFRKIVLAQQKQIQFQNELSVSALVEQLKTEMNDNYQFVFRPSHERTMIGNSPEKLIQVKNRSVETESLAGTQMTNASTDSQTASLESQKTQSEHEIVIDHIRSALDPFMEKFDQQTQSERSLKQIKHLLTPIKATLTKPTHVLTLLDKLHPTPAVGGVPKSESLDLLKNLEPFERGYYASPIGWFDHQGNGEFTVGIRSGVIHQSKATLFSGAGIVAGSKPAEEWTETQWKFDDLLNILRSQSASAS